MTAAEDVLDRLARAALTVRVAGDFLRVTGRKGSLTAELCELAKANKPALLVLLGTPFRYVGDDMGFGDVAAGWTAARWAAELRRRSEWCDERHAGAAEYFRQWATNIEARRRAADGGEHE